MFYPYPSHYLYDIMVVGITLLMARQVFNLSLTKKQLVAFVTLMMVCYQANFYIVEPLWGKEFKYITLYFGFLIAYTVIVRLNLISSLIVILSLTAFNGIWTNINLYFMLQTLFGTYAEALAAPHVQYTCYVVSVVILSSLMLLFKVKILDIQRYS